MEFFIDLGGRSLKVGKLDISVAIKQVGYIYVDTIDRADPARSAIDRTAIVSLYPGLTSELALASLGYKLADLGADRIVVVSGSDPMQCPIFTDDVPAMKRIVAIARGEARPATPASVDKRLM